MQRTHNPSVQGSSPCRPTTSDLQELCISGVADEGVDTLSDALPVGRGRLYTRTLHLLTATAFVLGAALVVTVDYAESVDTSTTAYGNEPWEFVPVAR